MERTFITWLSSYSVGNKMIDDQHKKLIEILNSLYNNYMQKKPFEDLMPIINELADYTHYHFETEEKLFRTYQYEKKSEHVNEHMDFIIRVKEFIGAYKSGKATLTMDIMNFLGSWVKRHINGSDKDYIPFLSENNLLDK